MPSPIPEITWASAVAGRPFKEHVKARNRRVREAFEKCRAAGAIRLAEDGSLAKLYQADESILDNVTSMAGRSLTERKRFVAELKKYLWNDEKTATKIQPYAPAQDEEDRWNKIRENVLRLTAITDRIEKEAKVVDRYIKMVSAFENVETYVNALLAGLIAKQGFGYRFKRSEFDPAPMMLCDQPEGEEEYEIYKAMIKALEERPEMRQDVADQMKHLEEDVLENGSNAAACEKKSDEIRKYMDKLEKELQTVKEMLPRLPIEQRGYLEEASDFYNDALQYFENYRRKYSR